MIKLNKTLLASLTATTIATFSMMALAGHHEEGEKAMDAAKEKGEEMMMGKTHDAKSELEAMRTEINADDVKDKIDEAQDAVDMSKLQDEAEAAVEEVAPD